MARKRKGDALHGWVLIDKPAGVTSSAVVNKVKWVLNAQKAGHAGTLDPDATGLLAIALGEATKTVPYLTDALKAYEFTVTFGTQTSTDDASGMVVSQSDHRPDFDQITHALPDFIGDIEQIPPAVSAVKIDGERAYKRVRNGEEVILAPRPLFVETLELLKQPNHDEAILRLICGKGGYVRSIARDLGRALGTYAHVKTLRRIWSGPFDIADCLPFSAFEREEKTPELRKHIKPILTALTDMPALEVLPILLPKLANGNAIPVEQSTINNGDEAYIADGANPAALGYYEDGMFHPTRVFNLGEHDQ